MRHRLSAALLTLLMATSAPAAPLDVDALWRYDRPADSEARFRAALDGARGDDALVLRSQIARSYSLRGRFVEAHAELDAIAPLLATAGPEPRVRALLERGRTLRSAGSPAPARPLFEQAFALADVARLAVLAGDALHMSALVAPTLDEALDWNRRTADYAGRAADPAARRWQVAALNNSGHALREAGRLDDSLQHFRDALEASLAHGNAGQQRVARWQVANLLRLLGRADEALSMQLALEVDNAVAGQPDPYVFDELALLYEARGDAARAASYRAIGTRPTPR